MQLPQLPDLRSRAANRFCRILIFILTALFADAPLRLIEAQSSRDAIPPDYRFKIEVLARGMPQPLLLHIAPDGRIFFNELGGKLKIWKPRGDVVEAGTLPVFDQQENGFLGFALDPQFARNQ